MCRSSILSCVVLFVAAAPVVAQRTSYEQISAVGQVGGTEQALAGTSADMGIHALPGSYRPHTPSSLAQSDFSLENWLIVAALGICFTFGLTLTLTLTRRQENEVPDRLF